MTSISNSSHLFLAADGKSFSAMAEILLASVSATDSCGWSLMVSGSGIAQANVAAEPADLVGGDDNDEGDRKHHQAEHRNRREIAAFVEVEDQHGNHLGFRGEQHDRGRKLADHADKNKAPGRDHAGAQERRRDAAERLQARGAEDAARVLELGMDPAERRLQLLVSRWKADRDEREEQNPERAVKNERRPRIAQEETDAENNAGNRDRCRRQKSERTVTGDRFARGYISDDERENRTDRGRERAEQEGIFQRELGRRKIEQHEADIMKREILQRKQLRGHARK